MKDNWFVIINPTSGNGTASKKWPDIKDTLTNQSFKFNYKKTEYPQHAIDITVKAVEKRHLRVDIAAPTPETPSMTMALEKYIEKVNNKK